MKMKVIQEMSKRILMKRLMKMMREVLRMKMKMHLNEIFN
jgi:hypothetical protein